MKQIIIDDHIMTQDELKQLSKAAMRKLRLTHKMEFTAQSNILTRLDPVAQAKQKSEKRQLRVQNEKRQRRLRFLRRLFKWQDRRSSATPL